MAEFPELERTLRAWVLEAVQRLLGSAGPEESYDLRRWRRDSDGIYRNRERVMPVWRHAEIEALWDLPSWAEVERTVQEDPRLEEQVGQLVGSDQGGRLLEMQTLGRHVLPLPGEMSDVEGFFSRRFSELDGVLGTQELEYKVVWPLPGLSSGQFPVQLEQDVELNRMTEDELTTALNLELVQPTFPGTSILMPDEADPACLRYHYRIEKMIGDRDNERASQLVMARQALIDGVRETFEQALALLFTDPITVTGQMAVAAKWNLQAGAVTFQQISPPQNVKHRRQELDEVAAADLQAVWKQLRQPGLLQQQRALALALRRLSYQARRERIEDELVDVLVAAEALYLSDVDYEELGFRLSLRAAALANPEKVGLTKRQVFDLMRAAYKVRSKVVHGDIPKTRDLRVAGAPVQLPEFVEVVERVVRQGLREALRRAANATEQWPPDWDGLTLPN